MALSVAVADGDRGATTLNSHLADVDLGIATLGQNGQCGQKRVAACPFDFISWW